MERDDLNPTSPFEAKLDERLRASGVPPLPDDGFSARVVASLPRRRSQQRYLWILPIVGAAVGGGIALLTGASVPDLTSLGRQAQNALGSPATLLVLAIAGGALALLFSSGESMV